MVLYLCEVDEFMKKANDKLISAKILYDGGQYATCVSVSFIIAYS